MPCKTEDGLPAVHDCSHKSTCYSHGSKSSLHCLMVIVHALFYFSTSFSKMVESPLTCTAIVIQHTRTHARVHTHKHTQTHTYACAHTYTHTHSLSLSLSLTHTQTDIQTHTRACALSDVEKQNKSMNSSPQLV